MIVAEPGKLRFSFSRKEFVSLWRSLAATWPPRKPLCKYLGRNCEEDGQCGSGLRAHRNAYILSASVDQYKLVRIESLFSLSAVFVGEKVVRTAYQMFHFLTSLLHVYLFDIMCTISFNMSQLGQRYHMRLILSSYWRRCADEEE